MADTATKTAVQVPCSLIAFKAILYERSASPGQEFDLAYKLRTISARTTQRANGLTESKPLPTTQVMYSQYATAMNSRPMRPPIMYPTSATLYTSGCRILNFPTIQPTRRSAVIRPGSCVRTGPCRDDTECEQADDSWISVSNVRREHGRTYQARSPTSPAHSAHSTHPAQSAS
jgi:hypothetical protein